MRLTITLSTDNCIMTNAIEGLRAKTNIKRFRVEMKIKVLKCCISVEVACAVIGSAIALWFVSCNVPNFDPAMAEACEGPSPGPFVGSSVVISGGYV